MVTGSVNEVANPLCETAHTIQFCLVLVCQCLFIKTGVLGQARQSEIQLVLNNHSNPSEHSSFRLIV